MLDNIEFTQLITPQQHKELLNTLRSLNKLSHREFENTGVVLTQTNYKECFFKLTPKYLKVVLSLSKFLYGTNQINVTRVDASLALSKLQELLGIDISTALVTRADIAYNILMDQPIETYFKSLCSKDDMKRWTISNETLYFTNKKKGIKLIFYHKPKQLKDTKQLVLPENLGKNLLRYELSIKARMIKKLFHGDVTCANLVDESFYTALQEIWFNEYQSIIKLSYVEPTNYGKNLSEFKDYLILAGIEKIGASAVFDIVDTNPFFKVSPKVKYNIKKMLRKLILNKVHFDGINAVEELDFKMLNILKIAA